jgi:hypothetical protein
LENELSVEEVEGLRAWFSGERGYGSFTTPDPRRFLATIYSAWAAREKALARVAALEGHLEHLQEELFAIAHHPSGWPPPEEENESMRSIAACALQSSHEFYAEDEDERP